jgi:hypothetical protein
MQTSKLANAIVTLAKIGDFTNPNAVLASNTDDPARPFELLATGNNQYLRTNSSTGTLGILDPSRRTRHLILY